MVDFADTYQLVLTIWTKQFYTMVCGLAAGSVWQDYAVAIPLERRVWTSSPMNCQTLPAGILRGGTGVGGEQILVRPFGAIEFELERPSLY